MSFANDTPISTPSGWVFIQDLRIGDSVSAAFLKDDKLSWETRTVEFSEGADDLILVSITYGDNRSLVVSPDQLFMLANKNLIPADKLNPGRDQLLSVESNPVPIRSVERGEYQGGIHQIATSLGEASSPNGHLLNSNAVITGDYALQIHVENKKT